MTDAQFAEIIRHLKRIENHQRMMARSIKIHDMKADGEKEGSFPWLRLPTVRANQISRVREELSARCGADGDKTKILTSTGLTDACKKAFYRTAKGYPSIKALRNACCRVHVLDFV